MDGRISQKMQCLRRAQGHKTHNKQKYYSPPARTWENFRVVQNTFLNCSHLISPLHPACTFLSILQARILSVLLHLNSLPIICPLILLLSCPPPFLPHFPIFLYSSVSQACLFYSLIFATFLSLHLVLPCSSLFSLSPLHFCTPPSPYFPYTPPFGRVVGARGGLKGVKAES